ncbi:MAG TPA: DUF6264 family protein [Agromyces mariniharenae]|nr:DUF6264 family protein [Agromyces mariniharenae]
MSQDEAARTPDAPGQGGAADERPRPRYGEYAPEGWTWQPPAEESAAPVQPAPPVQPTAPPPPPAPAALPGERQPSAVDRVVTIALLALGAFGAINTAASLQMLPQQFSLVYEQQGVGDFTPPEWLPMLTMVGTVLQLALYAATLGWSILRLRARKTAFWVPILGGVLSLVLMMVLVSIVFLNDPTFVAYIERMAGTTAP